MAQYAQKKVPSPQHSAATSTRIVAPGATPLLVHPSHSTELDRLHVALKQSPQAQAIAQLQHMADQSPRMAQLAALAARFERQSRTFATAQRQAPAVEEPLQGKFNAAQRVDGPKDDELLQGNLETVQRVVREEELLRAKFGAAQLKQEPAAKSNHTSPPDNLKSGIESLSGMSMDNVKVHYGSNKPAQLDAKAYAQGTDIRVAPGQEQHLPHEAWHVVQQAQGRARSTIQRRDGALINDDAGLEREADVMAGATMTAQAKLEDGKSIASDSMRSMASQGCGVVAQLLMNQAAFQASTQTGFGAAVGIETRPADVAAIDAQIAAYHALPGPAQQADAHARLAALHGIQTAIHTHFSLHGMHRTGHRDGMLDLLDDVRAEHRLQIGQLVHNGHAPWVPGRVGLPAPDVAAMDATWAHLTGAAVGGSLTINPNVQSVLDGTVAAVPGFRDEMLAHIARLLTTETGRRLVTGLDAGAHAVSIEPTYRDLDRHQAEGMVKAYGAETPGQDQEQAIGLPGVGSQSVVRMMPGSTDHQMVDFNAADEPILSPAYIGLGHELIHAMHNQRGVAWAANTHNPGQYAAGKPRAHYHNPEEFHTIAHQEPPVLGVVPEEHLTENMLRAESNLAAREGHTGGRLADVSWSTWRQRWLLNGANPRG